MNDAGELTSRPTRKLLGHTRKLVSLVRLERARHDQSGRGDDPLAHAHGIPVLLDGAQAVPHLGRRAGTRRDFYAFRATSLFGPTGVGVLYGKAAARRYAAPRRR
jgi:cysteine desulfurase/selenocysteine lyase